MAWADLDWPDLSPDLPPDLPEPQPHPAPPRPAVPADIAGQVRRAERRRGVFVPLCVLAGALTFCAGPAIYHIAEDYRQPVQTPAVALGLILAGLLVATLVPALTVLLVIGPTWRQRQQHLALTSWQRARREWLAQERQQYLASLDEVSREHFLQALRGRQVSGTQMSGQEVSGPER